MKKILLSLLLVASVGCSENQTVTLEQTLETGAKLKPEQAFTTIEHADLWFEIDPEAQFVKGVTTLTLSLSKPQSRFIIDLDNNYQVSDLLINGEAGVAFEHKQGEIIAALSEPQDAGTEIKITVYYQGHPHIAINAPWDGGYVWSHTDQGKPWFATAVQGEGCDLIWPCFDYPTFEALSTDIVIRVPEGLVAASNGVLIEQSNDGKWSQFHWRSLQPQNNYGIALNVGPYEVIEDTYQSTYGHSYPLVFYYLEGKREQAERLFAEFSQQLEFYEAVIGPYPFYAEKMGVVETPHKGMEHQTINAYGQKYVPSQYNFDGLLHHELAHEWFGNQVTNTNWDHMWLHEGFGAYMQPLYAQYLHGDFAYHSMMQDIRIGLRNEFPVVSNKPMSEDDVYKPDRGPASDIYQKGAWILHTLRHLIGDEHFFSATRQLVYGTATPEPGNFEPLFADTQDFIDSVNHHTGQDYTWFFEHYLYTAKLPNLVVEKLDETLSLRWETHHTADFSLPVDVTIDGEVTTVIVGKEPEVLNLPSTSSHVIIDSEHKLLKQLDYLDEFAAYQKSVKKR